MYIWTNARASPRTSDVRTRAMKIAGVVPVEELITVSKRLSSIEYAPFIFEYIVHVCCSVF